MCRRVPDNCNTIKNCMENSFENCKRVRGCLRFLLLEKTLNLLFHEYDNCSCVSWTIGMPRSGHKLKSHCNYWGTSTSTLLVGIVPLVCWHAGMLVLADRPFWGKKWQPSHWLVFANMLHHWRRMSTLLFIGKGRRRCQTLLLEPSTGGKSRCIARRQRL